MTIEQYANKKIMQDNMDEWKVQVTDVAKQAADTGVPLEMAIAMMKSILRKTDQSNVLFYLAEPWYREAYAKVEKEEEGK